MSKGARVFVATMDAQAKERATVGALQSEVDVLKRIMAALRERTDLGGLIAEAEENAYAEAEATKRQQEEEAKARQAAALQEQLKQINAQLAALGASGSTEG